MDMPTESDSFPHNIPEFSVGQLSAALQKTIEGAFARVRVRGEISGFKRAASGHLYFTVKDEDAALDACCWRPMATRLKIAPEDGMEVIATGKLTTFPGRSKYQLIVETIELAGLGALLALIEERKRRLAAEGLFDPARKASLPYLPEVIGIVTSPTGAVIRDMLHRLADRFPRHVLVWPVLVQGDGAAAQIAAAIAGFNAIAPGGPVPRPDLLIVARGGGSIEDLMAFNEEIVVRAAASSAIPLISAVGHETDTTLIDFASDLRAPTPTAAAEIAVPVRTELRRRVVETTDRLRLGLERHLDGGRLRVESLSARLGDPSGAIDQARQKLDDRAERLLRAWPVQREQWLAQLRQLGLRLPTPHAQADQARRSLQSLSRALDAGMVARRAVFGQAIATSRANLDRLSQLLEAHFRAARERQVVQVRDRTGAVIASAAEIEPGQALDLVFPDGTIGVTADGRKPAARSPSRTERDQGERDQGSLL